MTLDDLELL